MVVVGIAWQEDISYANTLWTKQLSRAFTSSAADGANICEGPGIEHLNAVVITVCYKQKGVCARIASARTDDYSARVRKLIISSTLAVATD